MRKAMLLLIVSALCNHLHSQGSLKIPPGATVKSTNGGYVVASNINVENAGTLSASGGAGGLQFSGSADNTIASTTPLTLNGLSIQKTPGAVVILQSDLEITGVLSFGSGRVNLGNYKILLGTTGTLANESESGYAFTNGTGYIEAGGVVVANTSTNLGGLGATLTPATDLGYTTIRRGHSMQANSTGSGSSILRYYSIQPTNTTASTTTLRFQYLDAELNGLAEPMLSLFKSSDQLNWSDQGFTTHNTTTNYVEKTGINALSTWTLSTVNNVLPVRFVSFQSQCVNGRPALSWETAGETGISRYDVERSPDGVAWQVIGSVLAGGTPYAYADRDAAAGGIYRIAEISYTGRKTYSTAIAASCNPGATLRVSPNPVNAAAVVSIRAAAPARATITLYDASGTLLQTLQTQLLSGINRVQVPTSTLPRGTYMLRVQWAQESKTIQIIK